MLFLRRFFLAALMAQKSPRKHHGLFICVFGKRLRHGGHWQPFSLKDACPYSISLLRGYGVAQCERSRNLRILFTENENVPKPILALARSLLQTISSSLSALNFAYSGDNSTPMHFRPVSKAAWAVVPPPKKGSRTVPPSTTTPISSCNSATGLPVI